MRLLKWLFASVDRQKQRVRKAAQRVADRQGDVASSQYMADFYRGQAQSTDPYRNWWAYAQLRQLQADNEDDLAVDKRRLAEDQARLKSQQLKLEKMQ